MPTGRRQTRRGSPSQRSLRYSTGGSRSTETFPRPTHLEKRRHDLHALMMGEMADSDDPPVSTVPIGIIIGPGEKPGNGGKDGTPCWFTPHRLLFIFSSLQARHPCACPSQNVAHARVSRHGTASRIAPYLTPLPFFPATHAVTSAARLHGSWGVCPYRLSARAAVLLSSRGMKSAARQRACSRLSCPRAQRAPRWGFVPRDCARPAHHFF